MRVAKGPQQPTRRPTPADQVADLLGQIIQCGSADPTKRFVVQRKIFDNNIK